MSSPLSLSGVVLRVLYAALVMLLLCSSSSPWSSTSVDAANLMIIGKNSSMVMGGDFGLHLIDGPPSGDITHYLRVDGDVDMVGKLLTDTNRNVEAAFANMFDTHVFSYNNGTNRLDFLTFNQEVSEYAPTVAHGTVSHWSFDQGSLQNASFIGIQIDAGTGVIRVDPVDPVLHEGQLVLTVVASGVGHQTTLNVEVVITPTGFKFECPSGGVSIPSLTGDQICWYAGEMGASCVDVCKYAGNLWPANDEVQFQVLTASAATNCATVHDALNKPKLCYASGSLQTAASSIANPAGCHLSSTSSCPSSDDGNIRFGTNSVDGTFSDPLVRPFCACRPCPGNFGFAFIDGQCWAITPENTQFENCNNGVIGSSGNPGTPLATQVATHVSQSLAKCYAVYEQFGKPRVCTNRGGQIEENDVIFGSNSPSGQGCWIDDGGAACPANSDGTLTLNTDLYDISANALGKSRRFCPFSPSIADSAWPNQCFSQETATTAISRMFDVCWYATNVFQSCAEFCSLLTPRTAFADVITSQFGPKSSRNCVDAYAAAGEPQICEYGGLAANGRSAEEDHDPFHEGMGCFLDSNIDDPVCNDDENIGILKRNSAPFDFEAYSSSARIMCACNYRLATRRCGANNEGRLIGSVYTVEKCLYIGADNESCDSVCSAQNASYTSSLISSNADCAEAYRALGSPRLCAASGGMDLSTGDVTNFAGAGLSCHIAAGPGFPIHCSSPSTGNDQYSGLLKRDTAGIDGSASQSGVRRICACD